MCAVKNFQNLKLHCCLAPTFGCKLNFNGNEMLLQHLCSTEEEQRIEEEKQETLTFGPTKELQPAMTDKLEILDPSALSDPNTVTYDHRSQTVVLPVGLVSVAGITVVTGGAELSCSSCMLAFGFWTTVIGFSCIVVGLWDQVNHTRERTSLLLGLGLVVLALSLAMVGGSAVFDLLMRKKRKKSRAEREDGKEVLVESDRVIQKVTV